MKKLCILLMALMVFSISNAQDQLYLIIELMKVDNSQESSYEETEAFWEKIHQQRANSNAIIGWDLWQLYPGGEDQGYQYATVTLFNNKAAMFKGGGLMASAKKAYPNMTEEQLTNKLNSAAATRDLAVRIYAERIATTKGNFQMAVGTMASFDWMKVTMGNYQAYEKAEKEVFQPDHQREVDKGKKGSWGLLRYISPIGSDTYASHMTVNMYKDVDHFFAPSDGGPQQQVSNDMQKKIQAGLATREMKMVNLGRLVRMVRKK